MAYRKVPDQAYLLHRLSYDPATGALTWLERLDHKFAGKPAGSRRRDGYLGVRLAGRIYRAHRLVWMMMTGEQPRHQIDHINHDRADNRWKNLRAATDGENRRNRRVSRNNILLLKGVSCNIRGNCVRYRAYISISGQNVYLGAFKTPEEAHAAYCAAARQHFGAFWSDGTAITGIRQV